MEKVIFGLWRRPHHDPAPIIDFLVSEAVPQLAAESDIIGARVLVEAPEVAGPGGKPHSHGLLCGAISVWLPTYQHRQAVEGLLRGGPVHEWHAWLVSESVPLGYGDNWVWELGQVSPGLTQLTLFDKPAGLDDARFFHLWHDVHLKTTLDVHPLWLYVRNEVVRPLTTGAPPLRGIVYQAARDPEDFIDPDRMYASGGDPATLEANMSQVRDETAEFINFDTIFNARLHEYIVRVVST